MDPNPKSYPVLSYVMACLPSIGPRFTPPSPSDPFSAVNIKQPPPPPPPNPSSSSSCACRWHRPPITLPIISTPEKPQQPTTVGDLTQPINNNQHTPTDPNTINADSRTQTHKGPRKPKERSMDSERRVSASLQEETEEHLAETRWGEREGDAS